MKMTYVKDMTNQELENERKTLKELIHDVQCFGVRDVQLLSMVELEMEERGIL